MAVDLDSRVEENALCDLCLLMRMGRVSSSRSTGTQGAEKAVANHAMVASSTMEAKNEVMRGAQSTEHLHTAYMLHLCSEQCATL